MEWLIYNEFGDVVRRFKSEKTASNYCVKHELDFFPLLMLSKG